MRRVKWVGDPSPWSDPVLLEGLVRETIPPPLLERLRRFENYQRVCVIPGKTELILGPAHGFTTTYHFGPYFFVQMMEDGDAERLFANEWDRWQFIDVTEVSDEAHRPPMTKRQWQALLASFEKLTLSRKLA
ncbi:MAG: hypothetical protein JSS40_08415 [Proteobacteria bacterium]|nr:hypothetical protein [Pseudomonadota bacterium]